MVTEPLREKLGAVISVHYRSREGRGHLCTVEHRRRKGDLDWFFAYPSDYAAEREGYRNDGKFIRESWRPAFEVVFVYDRVAGALELFAKGGKKQRAELSSIHVGHLWNRSPGRPTILTLRYSRTLKSSFQQSQLTGLAQCG